jgi:high-affinity iron transporter
VLPTLIIGLREGLEASLIVGIVAAFLRKQGRQDALRQVWTGVSLAVAICIAVGAGLEAANHALPQRQQEGFETVIGLIAVSMITYMVVWMKRHSRDLKGDLEAAAGSALASNSSRALVLMAFLAVLREGFETAVFLIAQFDETKGGAGLAGAGAAIGIAIAVALGYGIYRGGVRINLSKFFRATGLVLVLVAAGLLATAAHTAHEAGWISFGQTQALNLSAVVRPGTVLESVLTGVLGWQVRPVVLETVLYFAYLIPLGLFVAWPQRRSAAASTASTASPAATVAFTPGRTASTASTASTATTTAGAYAAPRRLSRPQVASLAALPVAVIAGAGVLVATHGSQAATPTGARAVTVALTDAGCTLDHPTVSAGAVSFVVRNAKTAAVTEAELTRGGRILAERENVTPGESETFSYDLAAGTYAIACPGGSGAQTTPLTVTAAAASGTVDAASAAVSADLRAATAGYVTWVQGQVALLQSTTTTFTDAVRANDLAAAEKAYPIARVYYERIEPVAESFGNLDPQIDNRIADSGTLAKLTGFHRIEYAMFVSKSLAGMSPVAAQLNTNIAQLKTLVSTLTVQPADLANGSTSLLDEVGKTKITGEEEAYSHVDLVDFVANVAGSQKAYELLRPALLTLEPALVTQIDSRFTALDSALAAYSTGPAPSDYVSYATIGQSTRRSLSQLVDALAAPLSQVAGVVVTA